LLKQILRKVFLEDWLTKLLALAITIALWIGVTGLSESGSARYKVPLVLRFADNAQVTNQPIDEVEVRISGDKRRLEQVREADLQVFVDLTSTPVGNHTIPLAPDTVTLPGLPTGIKLDDISPKSVPVRLEAIEEKDVPVRIETQGSVKGGFEIYSELVQPSKVRIRGPLSYVRGLAYVATEKVDVNGRDQDFTVRQVRISPLSNDNATLVESLVDVFFQIGETRVERTFTVTLAGPPARKVQVTLFGGRSVFKDVAAEDFIVTIPDSGDPQVTLPAQLGGRVEVRRVRLL